MPFFQASTYTRAAAPTPPAMAPSDTPSGEAPTKMMATRAPVAEPVVKPIMSGLPKGLPDTAWNKAPDRPKAEPTNIAVAIRGARTWVTK